MTTAKRRETTETRAELEAVEGNRTDWRWLWARRRKEEEEEEVWSLPGKPARADQPERWSERGCDGWERPATCCSSPVWSGTPSASLPPGAESKQHVTDGGPKNFLSARTHNFLWLTQTAGYHVKVTSLCLYFRCVHDAVESNYLSPAVWMCQFKIWKNEWIWISCCWMWACMLNRKPPK